MYIPQYLSSPVLSRQSLVSEVQSYLPIPADGRRFLSASSPRHSYHFEPLPDPPLTFDKQL